MSAGLQQLRWFYKVWRSSKVAYSLPFDISANGIVYLISKRLYMRIRVVEQTSSKLILKITNPTHISIAFMCYFFGIVSSSLGFLGILGSIMELSSNFTSKGEYILVIIICLPMLILGIRLLLGGASYFRDTPCVFDKHSKKLTIKNMKHLENVSPDEYHFHEVADVQLLLIRGGKYKTYKLFLVLPLNKEIVISEHTERLDEGRKLSEIREEQEQINNLVQRYFDIC